MEHLQTAMNSFSLGELKSDVVMLRNNESFEEPTQNLPKILNQVI